MEALFSEYEEIRRSGLFDPEYYRRIYPDIARRNLDPLVHYLEEGAALGRDPHPEFDAGFYLEQCRVRGEAPPNPLLHYLRIGAARGFQTRRTVAQEAPASPGARGKFPTLVAIEALDVSAGSDGGARLALSGWALAPSPITSITASIDGRILGTAAYGAARGDVARLYPDRPEAGHCGLQLVFDLAADDADRGEALLTVHTKDGETGHQILRFAAPVQRVAGDPTASSADQTRHLRLDAPLLIDGAMATPVRANLEISGWALARPGVAAIEITIDDKPVALADYGLRRLDVQAALPDWDGALASGFQALVPHRILPKGSHLVRVTLRDNANATTSISFRIAVEELADRPGPWALRRRMTQAEVELYERLLAKQHRLPRFLAIMPLHGKIAARRAAKTIASLQAQVYRRWHVLIVAPGDDGQLADLRRRLFGATNAAGERCEIVPALSAGFPATPDATRDRPDFVTTLTPGDELGVDAFLELALAAAASPEADFFYSDERCRNPGTGTIAAYFKPQWSPDLLLSTNYIGRLWCVRDDLLRAVTEPDEVLLKRGEYDLVLRCTEQAKAIRHVAAVLCERAEGGAGRSGEDPRALRRMLARRGIAGTVEPGAVAGRWRLRRAVTGGKLVSIIIPTCAARGLIETCLKTLRGLTAYRDYEIVCIENIAAKDRKWRGWLHRNADRVIAAGEPFNWARFSNLGAGEARGDYLLFLNDDIEITDPGWLDALLEHAQRPEVGVAGPRLLYPDGRVQHAGMFLAAIGQARHAFRYAAADDAGYFGLALTTRNVIAVTGACLITRREVYDALGGFDESQSIVNNDLDYCLRARERGLLTVYTPHATLTHHEAISRAGLDDEYDAAAFDGKWRDLFLRGDPYFSPHLSKGRDDFAADDEPTEAVVTGGPVLRREEVRKILIVKLDHIGDCVIAFPAVRRLKQLFPAAHITVLTSHASRPVWSLEPSVDDVIEFDFFHARSGLGELEREEADWQALRERLAPEAFDLAIDLRKHTETRPVLQHTGAPVLAGFDFHHQLPWLDIALEWTGDQIYARKRQHNGDDLINLVDAVAAACESDRSLITSPVGEPPKPFIALRRKMAAEAPLVCVHPAVGNDARQWPPEYFAAVIDRLIAEDGAKIVMIGADGDEEIAAALLRRVRDKKSVTSLVGKVSLAQLPALLAECALFLGNNSGPKHIAAGLGVPTVGVHSGTEDVREWGPVGPVALAVARDMVCAPCYLAHAADCRRGLACLRELEPARVYRACKRLLLATAGERNHRAVPPAGIAAAAEG